MATTSTAWLGTTLPPLAVTQVYQLLEAGAMQPSAARQQPCTVQGRFRICDEQSGSEADTASKIVERPISLYRAGLLIPGTNWSAEGHLVPESSALVRSEHRTVSLGAQQLVARQLHHLFPTAARPAILRPYSLQGWYLSVDTGAEYILLPCFEVARSFYYASGPHLISYCLSRLALDRICWALASPAATRHQTAHYCIAAHALRNTEIRLFAELLFNPLYR